MKSLYFTLLCLAIVLFASNCSSDPTNLGEQPIGFKITNVFIRGFDPVESDGTFWDADSSGVDVFMRVSTEEPLQWYITDTIFDIATDRHDFPIEPNLELSDFGGEVWVRIMDYDPESPIAAFRNQTMLNWFVTIRDPGLTPISSYSSTIRQGSLFVRVDYDYIFE